MWTLKQRRSIFCPYHESTSKGWGQLQNQREDLRHPGHAQRRAASPPHQEEPADVAQTSGQWRLPGEMFYGHFQLGRDPGAAHAGEITVLVSLHLCETPIPKKKSVFVKGSRTAFPSQIQVGPVLLDNHHHSASFHIFSLTITDHTALKGIFL